MIPEKYNFLIFFSYVALHDIWFNDYICYIVYDYIIYDSIVGFNSCI